MIEPKELEQRKKRVQKAERKAAKKSNRKKMPLGPILLLIVFLYILFASFIPLPNLATSSANIQPTITQTVSFPWPNYGQAAIGAVGYGLLDQHGEQTPLPMASVAKVLNAVAVLKVRPLQPGEQGPTLTMTADDVALYNRYVDDGQSVVKVEKGETITEYQALQALLLPSANNIADALASWAYGSADEYRAFVNEFTKTLGLANTHIADASGFSAQTTSTAVDLAKLAEIAMNNPVIAEIVAQPQATIPVAGVVYNVNHLIGSNGIVGIKTGNTDNAGGCFMFAAKRLIDSTHYITVVGAQMGAPDLSTAIDSSLPLIDEAFKHFEITTPVKTSQIVGTITQTGGNKVPIIVRESTPVTGWQALPIKTSIVLNGLSSHVNQGDTVGTLTLSVGTMDYQLPLVAGGTINQHNILWRLRHAGGYL